MTTIIIVSLVLLALFIIGVASSNSIDEKEIERLLQEYESALSGSDKKKALKAGRLYHAMSKKNKSLTLYDEIAIANDLSVMSQDLDRSPTGDDGITGNEPKHSSVAFLTNQ
jgi:predicted nucleic acid-binding protein